MPATKSDLLTRLKELNIPVTTYEHPAVFTVDEAIKMRGDIQGGHCKNLFLKDKKGQLWLVVCLEDSQIDLKTLPSKISAARISFGKPELLYQVLGIEPGSVTPFALINDSKKQVNIVLASSMMAHEQLNFHPLTNTATTTIASNDLLRFIKDCGHQPQIIAID